MKLLVFALTPPPHHGQSYMVRLMIEGFGGDRRKTPAPDASAGLIHCYHVNARFALDMADMGRFRISKGVQLLRYAAEALWCRFRFGANVLYYCPALPLKAPLVRDVILLLLLRPFFSRTVLFWHAAGLGEWLESGEVNPVLARLARMALGKADLAITPAEYNLPETCKFAPKLALSVPYGIPDPCPDFETRILPRRRARLGAPPRSEESNEKRQGDAPARIRVLFMALCTEEKGLLDAVRMLHLLNTGKQLPHLPGRFHLTVAGKFLNEEEEQKFWGLVESHHLEEDVSYAGFISGDEKNRLLAESDLFCFPTYFRGESFGLVLVEAMAFGLPIVTTRWRTIPEFFPPQYPGVVDIKSPDQLAAAARVVLNTDRVEEFRRMFLENYSVNQHLRQLTNVLLKIAP